MLLPLHELALEKSVKLLGQERGSALIASLLEELNLESIATADELMLVARQLRQRRDNVLVALGSILSFQATLYGSRLPYSRSPDERADRT